MNKCIFTGRLVRDPDVRYSNGANGQTAIASWTLAVDRKIKAEGQPTADFINFKAFGKIAEHIERFWRKGMKMNIVSHCQTGNYEGNDGKKVFFTEFVADEIEFGESKNASRENDENDATQENNGFKPVTGELPPFMNIPQGLEDDLPFVRK